jgi:hypothetical protein
VFVEPYVKYLKTNNDSVSVTRKRMADKNPELPVDSNKITLLNA